MNRRSFLKTLTAASAVPFIPQLPQKQFTEYFSYATPALDKYDIVGQQRGIARNLLVYDVFPDPNCYARYAIDRTQLFSILYSHSDIPKELNDIPYHIDSGRGEELLVPTGHHPLYALNKEDAEQKLKRIEDQEFIMLANYTTQKIKIPYDKFNYSPLTPICDAFKKIEDQDLFVTNIVMHPNTYKQYIKPKLGVTVVDELPRERITRGQNLIGYLFTSNLHLTNLIPINKIILTTTPEYLGVIPVRLPQYYNNFNNTYVSEQGMAIFNNKSMAIIELT